MKQTIQRSMYLRVLVILSSGFLSLTVQAASSPNPPNETSVQTELLPSWFKNIGLGYFTFFDGPGLVPGTYEFTPNVLGKPMDDGLRLSNYVSVKYNLSPNLAIDLQMRIQWILNNAHHIEEFSPIRWQTPRIGISGKLLTGDNWSLTGAVNTDFPYFLPQPIGGGVAASYRTTLFNPGLFAKFAYVPKASRWSLFSLVMPRIFFYRDRNVAEPQLSRAGFSPTLKNEFIFDVAPSVNYALSSSTGLRLGTEFIYSKLILSNWNPLHATLNNSDLNSQAWRLAPVPLQLGLTHEMSKAFSVSVFMQTFPVAAQRVRRDGSQASFSETASLGMWISGTLI
jgi:hypothetical protein